MTTQATVSTPRIALRPAVTRDSGDVSVTATFCPCSPIGSTEVVTSLDPLDDAAMLTLLDATITRLTVYRAAYQQAMTEDTATVPPLPLPVPWYAW